MHICEAISIWIENIVINTYPFKKNNGQSLKKMICYMQEFQAINNFYYFSLLLGHVIDTCLTCVNTRGLYHYFCLVTQYLH